MSVQSCAAKVVTFKYDKFPKVFTHTCNITEQLKCSKPYIKLSKTLNIVRVNLNPYHRECFKTFTQSKRSMFLYIYLCGTSIRFNEGLHGRQK